VFIIKRIKSHVSETTITRTPSLSHPQYLECYVSRGFQTVHTTSIISTIPGKVRFTALKYYSCPTKTDPGTLTIKVKFALWDILLHRRNQQLQPEKSLWSKRAWSYSSPFTKRPPKYRPFNASRALSASKTGRKQKNKYFAATPSYIQFTITSRHK
jgi:hypothetical protein